MKKETTTSNVHLAGISSQSKSSVLDSGKYGKYLTLSALRNLKLTCSHTKFCVTFPLWCFPWLLALLHPAFLTEIIETSEVQLNHHFTCGVRCSTNDLKHALCLIKVSVIFAGLWSPQGKTRTSFTSFAFLAGAQPCAWCCRNTEVQWKDHCHIDPYTIHTPHFIACVTLTKSLPDLSLS